MAPSSDFWRERKTHFRFEEETFVFPAESFPISWDGKTRTERSEHKASTPIIPMHLRPKRGLPNYHILWEAPLDAWVTSAVLPKVKRQRRSGLS